MSLSRRLILILVGIGFFVTADFGFVSEADAAIFIVFFALLRPRWSPYFLLMLASVQDARGLGYKWSYAAFAVVSLILIGFYLVDALSKVEYRAGAYSVRKHITFAAAAVTVIAYGIISSALSIFLDGYAQSHERPFFIVGFLMALMVIAAVAAVSALRLDKDGLGDFKNIAYICISHSVIIAFLQIVYGPGSFRSAAGAAAVVEVAQLSELTALGFPRITSAYLSPNAFALSIALLFMVIIGIRKDRGAQAGFSYLYAVTGIGIGVLALSKAMVGFFLLTSIILILRRLNIRAFLFAAALSISAVAFLLFADMDVVTNVFRFSSAGSMSYRASAWEAVLKNFGWQEWLFGTGLSHWQVFFSKKVGFSLSDPHTLIFSIPGTFGIMGVFFYLLLMATILRFVFSRNSQQRILAVFLFVLLFVKDMVSIPYVFGNTPLTFLLWISLSMLLASKDETEAAACNMESDNSKVCYDAGKAV